MSESMELQEWLPQAERLLPKTGKARGDHGCGDGGSLMLSRSDDGSMSAYCFRCGARGFHRPQESMIEKAARLQREQQAESLARQSTALPEPRVYRLAEWPTKDKLWFYKMGLSPARIAELGLYYCPTLARVVLPIIEDEVPVFWLARSQTRTPKWTGPRVPKHGLTMRFGVGKSRYIVLTEDPLSAYKVGLVAEAWSLLGTKLNTRVATELVQAGRPVITWLDDDQGRRTGRNPGQEAASAIRRQLRALGVACANETSPRDPKYLSRDEIEERLSCVSG